ncbi:uncharacterized protein [Ptychodera flava]|uniref:uncharacterized protein n=1 Tax=Ptychodera flava TaxID=63121 RepID=UPI00396A9464
MQGLESIAAGLPVLAPMGSSFGDLITVLCPLFASCLLYDSTSKDDLSKKVIDALSRPEIAAKRAKELKKQYQENCEVSTTHQDFLSHFVTSPTAVTNELPIGITSPGPQSPQSDEGISSDGTQPLSPTLEEDNAADHSSYVGDKAKSQKQPASEPVKNMDKLKIRKRKKTSSIMAEATCEVEEKKMKPESKDMDLENRKKIKRWQRKITIWKHS